MKQIMYREKFLNEIWALRSFLSEISFTEGIELTSSDPQT